MKTLNNTSKVLWIVALVALMVACVLALCPAAPGLAWADPDDGYYRVNDFSGTLSKGEERELSDLAKAEGKHLVFDFEVYITDKSGSLSDLAPKYYERNDMGYGNDKDGILLTMRPSDGEVSVYVSGLGAVVFSDLDMQSLESAAKETLAKDPATAVYNFLRDSISKVAAYRGVEPSQKWVADRGSSGTTAGSGGSNGTGTASSGATAHTTDELAWYPKDPKSFQDFHNDGASRVVDNADLLTDEEERALAAKISDMRERLGIDFVLLTDVSSYGLSRAVYAADYYQFNGYGTGDDYSGVIYFVCMEQGNRGYWTAARGSARGLLTEENVNYMDDLTYGLFKNGEYGLAIETQFSSLDTLYTNGEFPMSFTFVWVSVFCGVVVGIIVGILRMRKKKNMMKTVHKEAFARQYVTRGPEFIVSDDRLTDRKVIRKPIHESSSGGGGGGRSSYSGGYSSSGGGSFSGGGRSF